MTRAALKYCLSRGITSLQIVSGILLLWVEEGGGARDLGLKEAPPTPFPSDSVADYFWTYIGIDPLVGATWRAFPPALMDGAELLDQPGLWGSGLHFALRGSFTVVLRPGSKELLAFCVFVVCGGFLFVCFAAFHSLLPMYLRQCGIFPLTPPFRLIFFLLMSACSTQFSELCLSKP